MYVPFGRRVLPCLLGASLVAACSDGSAPTGSAQGTMSFTQGSGSSPAPAASAAPSFSAAPISLGGKTLVISQVQVVLSEVELKQMEHAGLCDGEVSGCEEFSGGPVLVDLPLEGGVVTPLSTGVAAGTYSGAELKIDIPEEGDAATTAFLAAHPSWPQSTSVHVVGTFDAADGTGAQPFDVYLAGEAELELAFSPPVVVDASVTFNVTVAIDPSTWFVAAGGTLIDPRALATDASLEASVFANIESAFHAFEDENKDGQED
ncbi:MAG: hypothetical protein ABIQ49_07505 [Gemmatimonadales bacterium]